LVVFPLFCGESMERQCSFCRKSLLTQQSGTWRVLPCGHVSCSECDIKSKNIPVGNGSHACFLCLQENSEGFSQGAVLSPTAPYRPFMKQMAPNPQQPQISLPPFDSFPTFQPSHCIPTFVPSYIPPHLKGMRQSMDGGNVIRNGNASIQSVDVQLLDNFGPAKDEGLLLEKNLNAVHVGLKARVSDVFGQIMRAISVQQETINNVLDERFADIGERLSGYDQDLDAPTDISAEIYKVTEEVNAKLAEAKLMIDVINSLERKNTLSAFFEFISTNGSSNNSAPADLTPVIDTTLSKPMIRSWSDSASQSAVLITWTTPRDFELLHRSEGFWYELEQRLASEPESSWHNVYKGVERTFVCKNMRRGTKYLFRCCVCVARHRYSHWSPEVLIVPGTGLPDGKQNLITPEISKALEQEVARNFTSGAVSAAGSSGGPAVVTTVIVPISSNNNHIAQSSSSPSLSSNDSGVASPDTASLSPSPPMLTSSPKTTTITTITTDPVQAASTIASVSSSAAAVAAAVAAAQGGSSCSNVVSPLVSSPPQVITIESEPLKGKKQRPLPLTWNSFIPGPNYELSQLNKVATALHPGAIVLGHVFPKNTTVVVSVRILRGSGIFIGVAPSNINQTASRQYLYNGWFLDSSTLSIGSHPPYRWKAKPAYPKGDLSKQSIYFPHEGDTITISFNSKTNCLRFSTMTGTYLPGKYTSILSPGCRFSLVPAVVLLNAGDSVLLQSSFQGSI